MDVFKSSEALMGMSDGVWMRHANRWSVWTRFTTLPLLILAIWSRDWIGWWALIPVAGALFWIWWNPRAFPPARRTDTWSAQGVFGERVFLNRKVVPIPAHHERAGLILAALSAPGVVVLVYGLVMLHPWATALGAVAGVLPKVWFVDRMVWLYADMKDAHPAYRRWSESVLSAPPPASTE